MWPTTAPSAAACNVYFIPLGSGQDVGQRRKCMGCGQEHLVDAGTYRSFVTDRHADISRLVQETNPRLLDELTDRLVLEERARGTGKALTDDERATLLAEPFRELSQQVSLRFARGGKLNVPAIFTLFGSFVLLAVGATLISGPEGGSPVLGGLLIALFFGALITSIYLFASAGRRYMKRRIVPLLARSLAPLKPTEAELTGVLQTLKANGRKIGRKLKVGWIVEAIAAAGTRQTGAAPPTRRL
jgi:hypothetical protein